MKKFEGKKKIKGWAIDYSLMGLEIEPRRNTDLTIYPKRGTPIKHFIPITISYSWPVKKKKK